MPLPRRSAIGRRGWTDQHIEALIGHDWFNTFGPDDAKETLELRREAWEELGDGLLFDWVRDSPFTRPHSWWTFNAPERRRCVNGIHPHDVPEHIAHVERTDREYPGFKARHDCLHLGVPNLIGGPGFDREPRPEYEDERNYLIRLELLTDHERELLATESQLTTPAPRENLKDTSDHVH